MEMKDAVKALAAIAHESRLTVFRLLVQAGPGGLPAGQLAEKAGIPPSSLSFHLKELVHAGLLTFRQEGRFVIYEARFESMAELLAYLTDNCCGGAPCVPLPQLACAATAPADAGRADPSDNTTHHD